MSSSSNLVILDYGAGNISSVNRFFLNDLNCNTKVMPIEKFNNKDCDILVIPGVGHFGSAAKRIRSFERHELIKEFAKEGKLILGFCLGAQILTLGSEEAGPEDNGLGLIPMYCRSLEKHGHYKGKMPRTGWATVKHAYCERASYYFVHSYYMDGNTHPSDILRVEKCIEDKVPAYVSMNSLQIHAIQFHPEKSGRNGYHFVRRILENA